MIVLSSIVPSPSGTALSASSRYATSPACHVLISAIWARAGSELSCAIVWCSVPWPIQV
ncbi:hypothetical protein D3C83_232770 [compost metagenome]